MLILAVYLHCVCLNVVSAQIPRPTLRYVLECAVCGPIFNSRPQLVCSYEPDSRVVQVEHIHVWPSEPRTGYSTSTHSARQVRRASDSFGTAGSEPRYLSSYDIVSDAASAPSSCIRQAPELSSYLMGLYPGRKVSACYASRTRALLNSPHSAAW